MIKKSIINNHSLITGVSFGLTSGVITTLGLLVGLEAGTQSKLAVLGGILTIAITDAFSDSLGIHISEESENKHTPKEIWVSSLATFIAKFIFALTFAIPVLIFPLNIAVSLCIGWGMLLLTIMSFFIASNQKQNVFSVLLEHLSVAIIVIIITHLLGHWIQKNFS